MTVMSETVEFGDFSRTCDTIDGLCEKLIELDLSNVPNELTGYGVGQPRTYRNRNDTQRKFPISFDHLKFPLLSRE